MPDHGSSGRAAQARGSIVQQMVADALAVQDPTRCWFAQVPARTVGAPGTMKFRRGGNAVDFVGRFDGEPVAFDVKSWRHKRWKWSSVPAKERLRLAHQASWLATFSLDGSPAGLLLVNSAEEACAWLPVIAPGDVMRAQPLLWEWPWATTRDLALGVSRSIIPIEQILRDVVRGMKIIDPSPLDLPAIIRSLPTPKPIIRP